MSDNKPAASGARTKRTYKKASLLERIKAFPADLYFSVQEQLSSLDLSPYSFAIGLFFITILCLEKLSSISRKSNKKNIVLDEEFNFWLFLLNSFDYLLLSLSVWNALYLFNCTKKYSLLHQDINEPVRSRNAKIVTINLSPPKIPGYKEVADTNPTDQQIAFTKKRIWEIRIWDPQTWSLNLFCIFSPVHIWVLSASQTIYALFQNIGISIFISLTLYLIISAFTDLVNDKQLLSGQVLHEFTEQFVYKLPPFRKTEDIGVGCGGDDDVGEGEGKVGFYTPTPISRQNGNVRI